MRNNYTQPLTGLKLLSLLLFVAFVLPQSAISQIYKHDFGTTTISAHPYNVAPTVINANLSASSWTNSTGAWSSNTGATGQAIQLSTPAGTSTINLTFTVAPGFAADITSFDFWSRRSGSGPQNWQLAINGTTVGNGTISTGGATLGSVPVSTPITALTGTVTVTLTVSNATGGNARFDDFTLNGSVYSNCNTVAVTSFSPATGPENTQVTIIGSGFNNAATVKFDGITTTFTVVSNTEIKAIVPAGITTGTPSVQATDGCQSIAGSGFTVFESECSGPGTEIFISELYDQSPGSGGMVELYNPTNNTITFNGEYTMLRYGDITDPNPTPGFTLTLTGSIAPHATYLINCGPPLQTHCITPSSSVTLGAGFNEDDKIELLKNSVVIDRAYTQNNIPALSTLNPGFTMIRKPNITGPTATYTYTDWNITDNPTAVTGIINNYCADLGMHTINAVPVPTITQPQNQNVCEGGTATFTTAVATGTGYTYQWKMLANGGTTWNNVTNGANYSGATTATLTVTNTPEAFNGNQYYCVITSVSCDINSNAALLTVGGVLAAPQATVTDATCAALGQAVVTSPLGTGLTYSLNGGTYQSSVTFNNLAAGNYNIIAKDAAGCTSAPFNFTVQPGTGAPTAPVIGTTTQPTCATATGSITITAPVGTGISYSIDGTNYQAGTTFTLTPGTYSVTAKNAAGCVSPATSVTINPAPSAPTAPVIGTTTQPTCATPTGSITITAPVGTGITYSIDGINFQAGTTFTLTPGTYSVTAKNAAGCVSPATSVTINPAPSAPTAPVFGTPTQPSCATPTGSITITAPTGTGITYSIDGTNYQAGTTFTLTPGTYSVTAKNAAGCVSPATSVTINPAPSAPTTPIIGTTTQPTCATPTGSITITAPTGTGITYSIDGTNYQTGTNFTLTPGTYSVTAKNAAGCVSPATSVTINPAPSAPTAPVIGTTTQPTCATPTGSITITAPVGTGITYSIDGTNYQAGTTFTLTPGTYNVTAKNAEGCVSPATSVTINPAPSAPAAPVLGTPTQPTCATPTGSITITAPVGTGITYSIDGTNYQAGTTFTLTPGTYNVTAKNAAGCVSPATSVTINPAPSAPTAPVIGTTTQPTCATPTGSITITAPTGTGITYSSNGVNYQSGTTFTLLPGTYNITVKNAAGCVSPATSVTINPAPAGPPVANISTTQPDCNSATGSITVNTPTGTGYQYSLNGGTYQTQVTFTGLNPGSYTITTQNADGCTSVTAPITINSAQPVLPPPTLSVTQTDCNTALGSISVTSPLGAGYTYSIDGTNYGTATLFPNLSPGTYSITVKNASGCISLATVKLITPQPATPAAPAATVTQQPTCNIPTGSITVTPPSAGVFMYSVNGTAYQNSNVFTGLLPGTYNITVRNTSGCVSPAVVRVINAAPNGPTAPSVIATNPADCSQSTGTLTILAPTGTGLTYSVDGVNYQTGTVFAGLPEGSYPVTVKNTAGCISVANIKVIDGSKGAPFAPTLSDIQPDCTQPLGSITVTSPTGTGLSYSIDGGLSYQTGATFASLEPGSYSILVKNAAGCVSTATTQVISAFAGAPTKPVVTPTQPDCTTATGSFTITSPVAADITFSINGAAYQAATTYTPLPPGTYNIIAKNGAGCISLTTRVVINPAPMQPAVPTVTAVQPTCNAPSGRITVVNPVGPDFTYSNDGGASYQTSPIFDGLGGGTYYITVQNAAGCTATSTFILIDAPPAPAPSPGTITGNNQVCMGDTVALTESVTGGVWSSSNNAIATVDAAGVVTPVQAGTVDIIYTVGTVCTNSALHTVTVYSLPQLNLTDIWLCEDPATGQIIAPKIVTTGLPDTDYTFVWSKGGTVLPDTTSTLELDETGTYSVTATNILSGCSNSATVTVGVSSLAVVDVVVGTDFTNSQTITVSVTGGSGDYEYSLSGMPYQDEPVFSGVTPGEYTLRVRDKHGCGFVKLTVFAINYPRFFTPNGDGANDTWNIKDLAGQRDAVILIFDRFGKIITSVYPSGRGWDGTLNGSPLPATDYWFTLSYTGSSGDKKEFKAHFSLLR